MKVRDYMSIAVETVRPDLGIMQLVHLLAERHIGVAVVTDDNRMLQGVVTERDCISVAVQAGYYDEPAGVVSEYMTRDVETCEADEGLMDVAQRIAVSPHRLFPVVENGRLIGILTRRHVLRALTNTSWFAGDAAAT